jgi:pSer/pThr/pTyr-binding forkhead associated (FHA) protein
VRCGRCGRENPDDITFCLDCGFKLHAAAPVVKRPEAPALLAQDPPAAIALVACAVCQTQNQVGHRFCVTCGGPLPMPAPGAPQPAAPRQTLDAKAMSPDFASTVPADQSTLSPFAAPLSSTAGPASPPAPATPVMAPANLGSTQILSPPSLGVGAPSSGPPTAHETPMAMRGSSSPPEVVPAPASSTPSSREREQAPLVGTPVLSVQNAQGPVDAAPSAAPEPCPRCGSPSNGGALFCKLCGLALRSRSAETLASVPEQQRPPPDPYAAQPPLTSPSGTSLAAVAAPYVAPAGPAVPAPALRAYGRLVRVEKDGTDGAVVALTDDRVDIGSAECEIVLSDDPYVAPRHARITRESSGEVYITDLNSPNRVYRKLREAQALTDGDLILLGQQVLRFEPVTDAELGLLPAMQHGVSLFGTAPRARRARLTERRVEGVTGDVFHLHRDETSLGRETADIVFTDDPFLSRRHAVVRRHANGTHSIEDLASSNGTFVTIRGRMRVRSGDIVRLGLHVFRFDLAEQANPANQGHANQGALA